MMDFHRAFVECRQRSRIFDGFNILAWGRWDAELFKPPNPTSLYQKFCLTYPISTFCLSKAFFLAEYDNVALHRLPIIRLPVDIQKIPNTSRLQYRYKQWPKTSMVNLLLRE